MNAFTIYHNPRCSKSRQALELLQNNGIHPTIVEYLKTPLTLADLKKLRTHFDWNDFVRHDEPIFKELKLSLADEAQVLEAIVKNPILMQRPIITTGDKAVIGRPPEKVLALLS
jgi:arsenate reductase